MRALAIGAGECVQHRQLARRVALLQEAERGVQAEEAVERQRPARLPGCTQRKLPAQSGVVAIAIRGNRGEPVESAAHDDQHQARAALIGASEGDPRSEQRATREQCAEVEEFTSLHGHTVLNGSTPHEFGRGEQERDRLRGAGRVSDGAARRGAKVRAE